MDSSNRGLVSFMSRHKPKHGKTLLVGSKVYPSTDDRRELYKDCIGIDMLSGEGVDLVHNMEEPIGCTFSHVDCCSVLEHTKRPWLVAENITRALEDGGTLLISVPFVWRVHGYPDDYWRMTKSSIPVLFPEIDWHEIRYFGPNGRRKKANSMSHGGSVWLERTEIFAFGAKR